MLFAGLQAEGTTTVSEAVRTRDHGELALRAFGAEIRRTVDSVAHRRRPKLHGIEAAVPGDMSSAAFFLCAAALFPQSSLVLDQTGHEPDPGDTARRADRLGAKISVLNLEESAWRADGQRAVDGAAARPGQYARSVERWRRS